MLVSPDLTLLFLSLMWLPLIWCSVAELPEDRFVSWSGSRDRECSYCVHLPWDDAPGECSEIPMLDVCMCVSCGKREAKLCHGYSGPMDLGGFSLESILMRKKESHIYMPGRSLKEQRLGCQDPLGWAQGRWYVSKERHLPPLGRLS